MTLLGERSGEAIGEAEMGVGLGQHRRDPERARGQHHRPGDVAAAAEDDVRPAPAEDRHAGGGSAYVAREGAQQLDPRRARKARHVKRVELVPRLRNEPRLDPVRRPRERHGDAARRQRLGDRESRKHVARGSSGGDQALPLSRSGMHRWWRC